MITNKFHLAVRTSLKTYGWRKNVVKTSSECFKNRNTENWINCFSSIDTSRHLKPYWHHPPHQSKREVYTIHCIKDQSIMHHLFSLVIFVIITVRRLWLWVRIWEEARSMWSLWRRQFKMSAGPKILERALPWVWYVFASSGTLFSHFIKS